SAASPVDAMTKQVLAQPSQAFEIPVADLMKTYGSNIKWVIDRLKQSTAGTRGSIVIPSSASEDEGDIHGGPELNAAVVLLMAQAYSNYINKITLKDVRKGAFVGFDPRYFSKEFAQLITRVMMGNGLIVYRDTDLDTYTATPLTSYMAYLYRLASGIEITSSHNPPNQNGVKSSTYYGGVDTDDISAKIAMEMEILNNNGQGQGIIKVGVYDESKINFIDAKKEYYERYISRVFTPDLIAIMKQAMDGGAKFIFDGLFGVGGSTMEYYLNRLFGDYNWRGKIIIMNAQTDPRIGGIEYPDPSRPETLEYSGVLEKLANNPEVLISATADMDADRTGTAVIIPDEDVAKAKKYGLFVSKMDFKGENVNVVRFTPQQIFTLIGYDRAKQAIARGIPADKLYLLTSIPTSLIGKEMIKSLGGKAILTTVGFKNLGYEAQSLDNTDPAALPILLEEESGGAIISPFDRDSRSSTVHRDKDTCVLALALYTMASRLYTEKRNMLDLYIEMSDKLGGLFYSERIDAYVPNKVIAESKKQDDKASADSIKQTVIKKFRAIDNVEGNLDKSENIATLCRLFDKTPEDVSKITEYSMDEVSLLVGEGDSWEHIKPRAKRFMFKDGESIEVFHTGRVDQEGPSISIFDKGGKLKARALIRPSGTESMVRVYLEILEPMETPNPQNLYDYFKKLLEYLDLHEYGSKGDGLSYLEQHLMNIRKYETIDPFNLSEKDVLRWDKIQQQV
ncbi:MAG: hypothetical protein KKE64_07345, partial [Candidatus Omnitrophica bacterium]|nr:hypothetical protein [Candidatus Omnitrophota bacterium]